MKRLGNKEQDNEKDLLWFFIIMIGYVFACSLLQLN